MAERASQRRVHRLILADVAQALAGHRLILKGGGALLLCHGSSRFSHDLDYDTDRRQDLLATITAALQRHDPQATVAMVKDGQNRQRYKAHWSGTTPLPFLPFKVEVSFAGGFPEHQSTRVGGIRVYDLAAMSRLKWAAFNDRVKPGDLEDLHFLASHHLAAMDPTVRSGLADRVDRLADLEQMFRPAFVPPSYTPEQLDQILLDLDARKESLRP